MKPSDLRIKISQLIKYLLCSLLLVISCMNSQAYAQTAPILAEVEMNSNKNNLLYPIPQKDKTINPHLEVKSNIGVDSIPAKPQKFVNPADFNNKILEKIWQQFVDASAFLNGNKDSSSQQEQSKK